MAVELLIVGLRCLPAVRQVASEQ